MKHATTLALFLLAGILEVRASASPAVEFGDLRTYATLHSIGMEWDVTGDEDHDARSSVAYRVAGDANWKPAFGLLRIDYRWQFANGQADKKADMLAGSMMFLQPGTRYELRLEANDPDGGQASRVVTIATRPLPTIAADAKSWHVMPDDDGSAGDGSADNPFRGAAAAQQAARPGDVIWLHRGNYGRIALTRSGEPGRYLAWRAAGDGDVVCEHIDVSADQVWIEGLQFNSPTETLALKAAGRARDVVVLRNRFTGFHNSIMLNSKCADWYIADNVIVGDNDPLLKHPAGQDGEGIELGDSSGHVICHNAISRVADGVSYPGANVDIFGNDIYDVSDDALEPDHGLANVRMWRNRLTNYQYVGVSFQPMRCGPWYLVRNQFVGRGEPFKFYGQDRFVAVNNTFVYWGSQTRMQSILRSFSRNNLYVSLGGRSPIWVAKHVDPAVPDAAGEFRPNWQTDVDYDGLAWSTHAPAFRWGDETFDDLKSLAAGVGIEQHAVRLQPLETFTSFAPPDRPAALGRSNLTLHPRSGAIDAGVIVPNLCDRFLGSAPDLGAHEFGAASTAYGPRSAP
jgi:hypothetical protein